MKKKWLKSAVCLLCAAVLLCSNLTVGALAPTLNAGDFSYELHGGKATVTGYTGKGPAMHIPETIDGYPVTAIEYMNYADAAAITQITIPKTVTMIGDGVFSETGYAQDPANWEEDVLYIGDCLIAAKQNKTGAYTIKEGTRLIASEAFGYCYEMTGFSIPESVQYIGMRAFEYTAFWSDASNWSDGLLYIDHCLVGAVSYLDEGIDLAAYSVCNIAPNTRVIADAAFWTSPFQEITLPDSITHIGNRTFMMSIHLEQITLPDTIEYIDDYAFANCIALTQLTVPSGVRFLGMYALSSCETLETITLPDSLTAIGPEAFANCKKLTGIDLPERMVNIGEHAFNGCVALKEIELPQGIQTISAGLFADCTSLKRLQIPDGVTSIGDDAFSYCQALEEIDIPLSVSTIGDRAFTACKALRDISLFATVTEIGNSAFSDCENLTIHGLSGTIAYSVANVYEIPFVDLGYIFDEETFLFVLETVANTLPADAVMEASVTEISDTQTAYDVTVRSGGEAVDFDRPVCVLLPLWTWIDGRTATVYAVDADGTKTPVEFEYADGFFLLFTDAPGRYQIEGEPPLIGDVDFSGVVDVADIMKAKTLIMTEDWTVDELMVSDFNGNYLLDVGDIMGIKNLIMSE